MQDILGGPVPLAIVAPGAELALWRGFLAADEAAALHAQLLDGIDWRQETVSVFGKRHLQPRRSAWIGEQAYTYSGLTVAPAPWPGVLQSLKARVEAAAGARFNSVLLNLYRDGRDAMGAHADDEPELGREPVIASLSLGAVRRLRFTPRKGWAGEPFALPLEPGSLLLMRGQTQRHWLHAVPRQARVTGPRINLTFRCIQPRPPAR